MRALARCRLVCTLLVKFFLCEKKVCRRDLLRSPRDLTMHGPSRLANIAMPATRIKEAPASFARLPLKDKTASVLLGFQFKSNPYSANTAACTPTVDTRACRHTHQKWQTCQQHSPRERRQCPLEEALHQVAVRQMLTTGAASTQSSAQERWKAIRVD